MNGLKRTPYKLLSGYKLAEKKIWESYAAEPIPLLILSSMSRVTCQPLRTAGPTCQRGDFWRQFYFQRD
jgi:hypothetical protein